MMRFRTALAMLAGCLLGAWPLASTPAATVAVLLSRDLPAYTAASRGFAAAMKERAPGIHLQQFDPGQTSSLASAFRARGVEAVFAIGTEAAIAAKATGLPVVYVMVVNPGQAGLSGCAGVTLDVPVAEQFRVLRSVLPRAGEVGVLYDPARSGPSIKEAQAAAAALGLRLRCCPVSSQRALPRAAERIKGVDVIWAPLDATVYGTQSARYVLQFALRNRIPVMGFSPNLAEAGALFAVYPNYEDIGRQGAGLLLRVLGGEAPGSIGPVRPSTMAIALNLRVADVLGVTIPPPLRKRAQEVYR